MVHVDRIEGAVALFLIGGQLLVFEGFKADCSLAHADKEYSAVLPTAVFVLLVRKRDVNLRNIGR